MVVQHLVVILLFLWKEVSSSPSNLPPCRESSSCFYFGCLLTLSSVCPGRYSPDMGCAGVAASSCSPEGRVSGGAAWALPGQQGQSSVLLTGSLAEAVACTRSPGASVGGVLFIENTHAGKEAPRVVLPSPHAHLSPLPCNKGTFVLCVGTDPSNCTLTETLQPCQPASVQPTWVLSLSLISKG